jgi:hypothetical protein
MGAGKREVCGASAAAAQWVEDVSTSGQLQQRLNGHTVPIAAGHHEPLHHQQQQRQILKKVRTMAI